MIRQLKAKLVEYQQDNNIDGTHLLELLQLKAKGRQESKSWDQKLAQESKSWTAERCGLSHQYIQFQVLHFFIKKVCYDILFYFNVKL